MLATSTVMEIVNKNGSLLTFFAFFHSFCIVPSSVIFKMKDPSQFLHGKWSMLLNMSSISNLSAAFLKHT